MNGAIQDLPFDVDAMIQIILIYFNKTEKVVFEHRNGVLNPNDVQ